MDLKDSSEADLKNDRILFMAVTMVPRFQHQRAVQIFSGAEDCH